MAACVWLPIGTHTAEAIRFKRESADFEFILDRLAPKKRALYLAIDNYSPADRHQNIYLHYGSWYQADKKGFVDFNFAWFPPQMLRFKTDNVSEIRPSFEFQPKTFDWHKHKGDKYDYFILRSETSVEEKNTLWALNVCQSYLCNEVPGSYMKSASATNSRKIDQHANQIMRES